MDDTTFFFVVLPLTACFVGFVFMVVFGADIIGWYRKQLAAQRLERRLAKPAVERIVPETPVREMTWSQPRQKELVHH